MEEEWTVDANEALKLLLVRPTESGIERIESFSPKFTYAIFGEDERIFGYKGLKINLLYDARDLRPSISVTSSKKFNAVGEVEAVNIKETMKEFLPPVVFQSRQDYHTALKGISNQWSPPGTLVKTIEKNGETYEVWQGTMADAAVKRMLRRIQVMVLLYIEGGSYIGLKEDGTDQTDAELAKWSVFFIYKKSVSGAPDKHEYTFQGFSTVYDFWMYQLPSPPPSPGRPKTPIQPRVDDDWELPAGVMPLKEMPRRARISQFLILPPYQGKGIGALLYSTIFELHMSSPSTKELTVEDPNEDFDLLRDLCDMKYLRANVPEFAALEVNTSVAVPQKGGILQNGTEISSSGPAGSSSSSAPGGIVDIDGLERLRTKAKIAPRQFWRLVEMHLMSKLPASVRPRADSSTSELETAKGTGTGTATASRADLHAYTLWRLLLKQRLYRRNVTLLAEFETTERILKLNETVDNVEWEYARILERLEGTAGTGSGSSKGAAATANGKRKAPGDEAGGEGGAEGEAPSSKKVRIADD
ncbi:histone acetyltransferase type B catalytic subunit [Xylariaceae sp. FL0804]|nr:histone acetyltransferase type B catalytic subunit [Xylariaceae sp. FL0804]